MKKIFITGLLLSPVLLFAQAYQLNLQGSRQTAMGSTGIADPVNGASQFFNPGSAAFTKSNSITFSISPAISKGTFTDASSNKVSTADNPVVTPFGASVLLGNPESRFRYGLVVYTPFGSTMQWKDGSAQSFDTRKISLVTVTAQPTVSYQLTDKLGIGAGLMYTYGHVDIEKDLPVAFSDGDWGLAKVTSSANALGVNAGLYYTFSKEFSAGVTYRSALKMKTSSNGKAEFTVPSSLAGTFPSQKIDARLPLPEVWGIGFSYKPSDRLTVNLDGTLSDWSPYDTIKIHYEEAPVAGEQETDLVRNYKKGYSVRLGAEYKLTSRFMGRVGLYYSKSPLQDRFVSADVPDANRLNPSVGLSYAISDRFHLDAVFLYEHISRKSANIVTDINGTYKFNLYIPSIGFTYKL